MPYCSVNGIRIYYEVSGEGFPMVLVHANPFDHRLWTYQIARFSTFFKVIAVDIRGYGRSDKPVSETNVAEMAEDIVGVCRQEKADEAILCGISVGGNLVLQMALDHPDLCKALIMVGCSSGPSAHQTRTDGYVSEGVANYHIQHLRDLVSSEFADSELGKYALSLFTDTDPGLKPDALRAVFNALERKNLTPRLGELHKPVIIINGELDSARPRSIEMSKKIKGAEHQTIPNSGHACCLEQPAKFDEVVMGFLRKLDLMPHSGKAHGS
ncbi:MAG: alpha/beta fold hydrolase [Deltaproteobacteria bacterium]|nr:alpha/beta fold hydrolase [Deltaproteobacteria bacterium]